MKLTKLNYYSAKVRIVSPKEI